jgi:hypothetical protein
MEVQGRKTTINIGITFDSLHGEASRWGTREYTVRLLTHERIDEDVKCMSCRELFAVEIVRILEIDGYGGVPITHKEDTYEWNAVGRTLRRCWHPSKCMGCNESKVDGSLLRYVTEV